MSFWSRTRARINTYGAVPFQPLENAFARAPAAQHCFCKVCNIPLAMGIYIALGTFIVFATVMLIHSLLQPSYPYTYDVLVIFVYLL